MHRKCLLYGTTHLYSYTVKEKFNTSKEKIVENFNICKNYTSYSRVSIFIFLGITLHTVPLTIFGPPIFVSDWLNFVAEI